VPKDKQEAATYNFVRRCCNSKGIAKLLNKTELTLLLPYDDTGAALVKSCPV
jgi:hypothetical protein